MRIVAVGSHLDDIEISAGGLVADAILKGHEVHLVVMSDSSFDDIDGNPSRERDVALEEGHEAAAALNVSSLNILEFPTKDIPYNSDSVQAIEREFIRLRPDIVLAHWPHDTHQDHRATALATISAARRINRILMYEPMAPSGRSYQPFRPQFYYPVSEEGRRRKCDALRAHESQFERYGREVWVGAVDARGIHHGFEVGVPYAESFEVMRWELDLRNGSLLDML